MRLAALSAGRAAGFDEQGDDASRGTAWLRPSASAAIERVLLQEDWVDGTVKDGGRR